MLKVEKLNCWHKQKLEINRYCWRARRSPWHRVQISSFCLLQLSKVTETMANNRRKGVAAEAVTVIFRTAKDYIMALFDMTFFFSQIICFKKPSTNPFIFLK